MGNRYIPPLILIGLSFVLGVYFYPQLPERVASHWDLSGEVNGYMPKFWGVFFMPILSVFLFLLFLIIPAIDPKKENIAKFRVYFDRFVFLIFFFLFYLYSLVIFWNLGTRFSIIQFLMPALGTLFYFIGDLISHALPNWTIGIRTPWTLSSEKVWKRTHEKGGILFKVTGGLTFLGIVFPSYAFYFLFVPLIFSVIYLTVYSYLEFRKERKS